MKNFFDNFACLSQVHCGTCRLQTDEGRQWRESIAKHFTVLCIDFECPQGKGWLNKRPAAPARPNARVAAVPVLKSEEQMVQEAQCLQCSNQRSCPNVRFCCGGQVLISIIVPCPLVVSSVSAAAE